MKKQNCTTRYNSMVKGKKLHEFSKEQVNNLIGIEPGSHVIFEKNGVSFHGIASEVSTENEITFICYCDKALYMKVFNEDIYPCSCVRIITKTIDFNEINVFVMQYYGINNSDTLNRALDFVQKQAHSLIRNNNFNFVFEVLTGKSAALFMLNPKKVGLDKLTQMGIPQNLAINLIEAGGTICFVSAVKALTASSSKAIATSTGIQAVNTVGELFGPAVGVITESAKAGHDIAKKKKELKSNKITKDMFNKFVAEQVTRSTHSIAGGIGGAVVGQMVIPAPVVGAIVGGIVGGLVGTVVGYGNAKLVGKAVESVQSKIHMRRTNKANVEKMIDNADTKIYAYDDSDELLEVTDKYSVRQMLQNLDMVLLEIDGLK